MTTVLYISTLVLNFAGALFGAVYVALNLFLDLDEYGEFGDKNKNACFVLIAAALLSLAFAFCSCLFAPADQVAEAVEIAAQLYALIALTWLALIIICGCAMLYLIISKLGYSSEKVTGVRTVFFISLGVALVSLVLTFLL